MDTKTHCHSRTQRRDDLAALANPSNTNIESKESGIYSEKTVLDPCSLQSQDKGLAERVYSWIVDDLDYRPEVEGIKTRVHPRFIPRAMPHGRGHGYTEFSPQALEDLCNGPCGPLLEYLIEQIKSRSRETVIGQTKQPRQSNQSGIRNTTSTRAQCPSTPRARELLLAIAQNQRAVEETKERIKQRRQLKSIKEIFHRQSLQKVRKLQKLHSLVLQYKPENSKIDTGDVQNQYTLEHAIQQGLEEISRLTRAVAIDRTHFSRDQFVDNRVMLHVYWHLNQLRENGGVVRFLSLIKGSKQQHLSQLQSVMGDGVWSNTLSVPDIGTTELLQVFREHHIERVVQIESVFNKFAAYEQERDELYAKMRFQAQRRNNKGQGSFFQELEETRAHLKGLETALAFIQMEQEIMVERVQSVQVHRSGLEVMNKASRVADQQMIQLQHAAARLIAMLKQCHESIPTTSSDIACGITQSVTEGLSQLSGLVQNLESRTEYDVMDLQACTEESQLQYSNSHIRAIQTPTLDSLYLNTTQRATSIDRHPQKPLGRSSLSSDSHILQATAFHQHELLQTIAASTARELRECMEATKNNTVSKMKASVPDIYMGSGLSKNEAHRKQHVMNIESLTSRFESDTMDTVRSIVDHEMAHQDKLLEMMQGTFKGVQIGFGVAQDIQSIITDNDRISSLLPSSKDHGSIPHRRKEADCKRIRYMR